MEGSYTPSMQTPATNVYRFGDLIIQRLNMNVPWGNPPHTYSFPQPFPNGCIAVIAQGVQLDDTGLYSASNSIQAKPISNSQFMVGLMSEVENASMQMYIIAIGF